jgi:exodeoxyribonuclease V beta subunit
VSAEAFRVFQCPLAGTRLIEASAGTGKTWNLCALYLRLLLERDLKVADILVVTFTNAATAELRERIRSRIAETLARLRGMAARSADPFVDELLARLRGSIEDKLLDTRLELALQSFDEASILTIHGFCQRALAEAPFSTGMPMQLTLLADDSEMRLDVVQDFWRRRIAGAALSPALAAHLLERKFTPQRLAELLARRLGKPLARLRWPEAPDTAGTASDDATLGAAFDAARVLWLTDREDIAAILREAQPRLHKSHYADGPLQQALQSWDRLLAGTLLPDSLAGLDKLDLLGSARLRPNKGLAPPAPHAFFDAAQLLLDLLLARSQALELRRLQLMRELLDEGPAALRRAKRDQRVLAFDDMLFNLHQRLAARDGAVLARRLRQRFAAALIDEFQDTDPLQYAIFRTIYAGSEAPLFLVGDPKQAIYSFRNADLHTYLRARDDARADYTLDENQRSTPQLLDALNALFGANPRAFMQGGLSYTQVRCGPKPRTPLTETPQPPRAALQLWQLPRGDDGQPLPKADAVRLSLQACAVEIARLLGSGATLADRALAAGDMAVLVRSHAQAAAMRRALSALGVGSVELSQASVFDSADAADLERVLAAMLQPQREPLLRAALATEAMGFDAAALQALSADESSLLDTIARFGGYRDSWLTRGVGRMLREWMRAEGVSARLLARPDGERRLTNLMHLAELLHEAAASHPAPEALQRWLQTQRSDARRDEAAQLRLESDRNLVQVVTIHKSKGLEYPLVFCPLLWDGHGGSRSGGEGVEYHDENGNNVIDFRELDKPALDAAKEQAALEAAAETLRLIYVALTRAVHRCTLVVGPYLAQQGKGAPSATQSSRARLNWLVAGAGLSPQDWLKNRLEADQIDAAWATLAQQHAPQVRLDPLPTAPGMALAPQRPTADQLAALPPPAHIPGAWWIGSYSALAFGARHDSAAVDHDLRITRTPYHELEAELAADDILRFPRGAVAGECLHALFERIDFGDTRGWSAMIDTVLQRFAPALPPGDEALRRRMLLRMLDDVMHAPLGDGLRLADVPRQRTLVELEFHLPSRHLDAAALARTMQRLGQPLPQYGFGTLQGYLRGFIDLVFEQHGRYYVLDWKSNHLGDTAADYAGAALDRAMTQHGYQLQALLYALALHRHLQQRLPDYRHERHFGGVRYLFVRGVRAAWTLPDGISAGVHQQRPTLQALQQLSQLLE